MGQMRLKLNRSVKKGGTGLHMTYWTWRARYITVMQSSLWRPSPLVSDILSNAKLSTPLQKYANLIHQLGGETIFLVCDTKVGGFVFHLSVGTAIHRDAVTNSGTQSLILRLYSAAVLRGTLLMSFSTVLGSRAAMHSHTAKSHPLKGIGAKEASIEGYASEE